MGRQKKIIGIWTALLAMLIGCALADGELSVVQSSCSILVYGNECQVFCCAQVHNMSDYVVGLERGSFQLLDGESVLADEEVERLWPYFLNPGEDGYLFQYVMFNPDMDGNAVIPSVTRLSYSLVPIVVSNAAHNHEMDSNAEIVRSAGGGYTLTVSVQNTDEAMAWNPIVIYGVYSGGGSLIFAGGKSLDEMGLAPGSTMELLDSINAQMSTQWESYGVEPAEIRSFAYFRRDDN